ncbi:transcription elongation regulator 1-like [Octopus sinensis]|uniref:Transcription elongation regulator 1-like n=1 Tax=Octopus sinensis TaxID=2607531 RepID=A0A7E6EH32_9MOLL|nr:transcription elongation regulator 1-like [Octopus sinensis]
MSEESQRRTNELRVFRGFYSKCRFPFAVVGSEDFHPSGSSVVRGRNVGLPALINHTNSVTYREFRRSRLLGSCDQEIPADFDVNPISQFEKERFTMEKRLREAESSMEELFKSKVTQKLNKLRENTELVVDKTKPVSKTLLEGTDWSIVWTGDDRMFFFNVVEKRSVWNCPEELRGRKDVENLMKSKPTVEGDVVPIECMYIYIFVVHEDGKRAGEAYEEDVGSKRVDSEDKKVTQARSTLPYAERVEQFRELLAEKNPTSTFDKELQKIVFDKRYTLLLSKERRQVFDQYIKEKVEEERTERTRQHKKRRQDFRDLLKESNLNHRCGYFFIGRSTYSEFAGKQSKDPRFQAIERTRDRESLFYEHVDDFKKKRATEKVVGSGRWQGGKSRDFTELLKENDVTVGDRWRDVKRRIENDPRYKAISSDRRGDLFDDYVQSLAKSPQNDIRYIELDCYELERKKMVDDYINDLAHQEYLKIENLLAGFTSPEIMDCKMGCRTFLKEELDLTGNEYRHDLYQKMIRVDPNEPTAEEHERSGILKSRYMRYRDSISSTTNLSFRVDGIKVNHYL